MKTKVEKDTSERWLLTYSDLMNLLLILFIILYSSSQLNQKKIEAVSKSMQEGFGKVSESAQPADSSGAGAGAGTTDMTYWTVDEYGVFYEEITKLINEQKLQDKVDVKLDDKGVVISFKDTALFQTGSATINADSLNLIDKIGSLLYGLDYSFILIEGHTDSDPINTPMFQDNMDLSSKRAGNVWRELVKCGLMPESMASIGYGEYRPIAENNSAENKAKNRRVVITILKQPVTSVADVSYEEMQNIVESSSDSTTDSSGTQNTEITPNPENSASAEG